MSDFFDHWEQWLRRLEPGREGEGSEDREQRGEPDSTDPGEDHRRTPEDRAGR